MTDAVNGVTAEPAKYEDGKYRRSRLSEMKAKLLRTSSKEQDAFAKEKAKEYKSEIPELTEKQATIFGKKTMQNERAAATVDNRMVYIDKSKMDAYKKAMPEKDHVYLDPEKKFDANVRKIISENPEDFYVDGEFSSDQYKRRLGQYTGFDNKANLDEIKTARTDYGVGDRTMRRAFKRAGYEREKDLTALYKSLAALGALGASAGTGALVGASFTSNVFGIHNSGTIDLLDTIHTSNAARVGAFRGLLAGVIPAAALALTVKDKGGKDIFNGNTAEEVVAKGEKNIETRISDEKNQKMVKAILKMPNLSAEDKAIVLKLAYGELTGKKVNDRELAAAYEIAKYCNAHPEVKAKDYDKLPGTKKPDKPDKPDENNNNNNNNNTVVNNNNNNENEENNEEVVGPSLCELSVNGNDGVKTHNYRVRAGIRKNGNIYGDNPWNVTMGKYRRADSKQMTPKDIAALRNHIFGKGKGLKAGVIKLKDEETINNVKYRYVDGKVQLGLVKKGGKMNYFKSGNYPGANYGVYDCENNALVKDLPSRKAANEKAAEMAKKNPQKYIFAQ